MTHIHLQITHSFVSLIQKQHEIPKNIIILQLLKNLFWPGIWDPGPLCDVIYTEEEIMEITCTTKSSQIMDLRQIMYKYDYFHNAEYTE